MLGLMCWYICLICFLHHPLASLWGLRSKFTTKMGNCQLRLGELDGKDIAKSPSKDERLVLLWSSLAAIWSFPSNLVSCPLSSSKPTICTDIDGSNQVKQIQVSRWEWYLKSGFRLLISPTNFPIISLWGARASPSWFQFSSSKAAARRAAARPERWTPSGESVNRKLCNPSSTSATFRFLTPLCSLLSVTVHS